MAIKPKNLSTAQRDEIIQQKAEAAGLDPQEIARLAIMAELMKAPSAIEQGKADAEHERVLQSLRDQEETAKNKEANRARYQSFCTHENPQDKKLKISGQLIGPDGYRVAFVQCNDQHCKKTWMWRATAEECQQGICLNDDPVRPRFANQSQLDYQESALPISPDFARKVGHPEVAKRHEKYNKEAVTA